MPDNDDALPPIPRGIHDVLAMAAADSSFREAVERDPDAALAAWGIALSAKERAILRAVPQAQLDTMIGRMAEGAIRRRSFIAQTAVSAASVLGLGSLLGVEPGCSKSDPPAHEGPVRPSRREMDTEGGISPHLRTTNEEPVKPDPCLHRVRVEPFVTLSGPARIAGEADLAGLRTQLELTCGALGSGEAELLGKLVYELSVASDGAISEIKTIENTSKNAKLDEIMRRHVERVSFFDAGEASRCTVTMIIE